MSSWIYYSVVVLLMVINFSGFLMNMVALPGNWLIFSGTALFCWLVHTEQHSVSWYVVGLLLFLATVGEVLEFAAGSAGAARSGASRRAMGLAIVGSIAGSLAGAIIGIPIPIVGSAVAALIGGAIGAAVGAAIGEDWKGRDFEGTIQVGAAAFWGRLLGTAGKVIVGAIMLVIATVDSIW
jgi:uncharacterized protein YqgC (DUF456 family)